MRQSRAAFVRSSIDGRPQRSIGLLALEMAVRRRGDDRTSAV